MKHHYNLFQKTFDMSSGMHKYLTIWKAYHEENQIYRYNLEENERIFLFNTKNTGYDGKNINHLNRFFCEVCCILYPYFNNLKSEVIGFQHYKRWYHSQIKSLQLDDVLTYNTMQVFENRVLYYYNKQKSDNDIYPNLANHCLWWSSYYNGYYQDLVEYLNKYYPHLLKSLTKYNNFHGFNMFVCRWDKYIEYCEFIWNYICFIADKYKFDVYSENEWAKFIKQNFIEFNKKANEKYFIWDKAVGEKSDKKRWEDDNYYDNDSFYYYRIFSYHIEFLTSIYAHYKHMYIYDKNNPIHEINL